MTQHNPPHGVVAQWCAANCIAPGARLVDPYGEGEIWLIEWNRPLMDEEQERLQAFAERIAERNENG